VGRGAGALALPAGRLVVADAAGALAVLFGDPAPAHGVTAGTPEVLLLSVAVPGVPDRDVEEALWTVREIVAG